MLARAARLSRADFSTAGKGKRAASAHFSVTILPGGAGRASVVVSKKVAKKAVDRNQLRRRIRSIIVPYATPRTRSFIVYARTGSTSLPYAKMRTELEGLLMTLPKV